MFCSIVRKRAKKLAVHGSSKMTVKVWFHKTVLSDNTKEVSFKLNRLFLLQACYEYTESNLSRLENRWKRTSQLKQTKNLHSSAGSVLSFHSSRQTAMKQSSKQAKLQNTGPLICMSLNKNSMYCVMPRSIKSSDTCK